MAKVEQFSKVLVDVRQQLGEALRLAKEPSEQSQTSTASQGK